MGIGEASTGIGVEAWAVMVESGWSMELTELRCLYQILYKHMIRVSLSNN